MTWITFTWLADNYRGDLQGKSVDQQIKFLEDKYKSAVSFGSGIIFDSENISKVRARLDSLPETDYRKVFGLATFGNDNEIANAKSRLKYAGIDSWDTFVERQKQIDALMLRSKEFKEDDRQKYYDTFMLMPESEFKATVKKKLQEDKEANVLALIKKYGSEDFLGAITDQIDQYRKIRSDINKHQLKMSELELIFAVLFGKMTMIS